MKALITGADGLLGSNLVRELLDQNFEVRVLLQPGSPSCTLDGLPIEKLQGDLLDEGDGLAKAVKGCQAVFHCAAITDFWADAELTWKVNLEGSRKVMDACLACGVKRLVLVGSASSFQFGTRERPGDEHSSYAPAYRGIPYMESKHAAVELAKRYIRDKGLDAVMVMPTFMLGNHDSRPSSGTLIQQFVKKEMKATSPGGRNFVHVRDVARAMILALEKGIKGECYILGGQNLTYKELFTMAARAAGIKPPLLVLPRAAILLFGAAGSAYEKLTGKQPLMNYRLARMALLETYYSPAKAVAGLGMPRTPVEEAVRDTVAGLRDYGHL